MCRARKQTKGFTLIELLVVIAIIGTLASVVLASLNSARERARDAARLQGMQEIQKALELYYLEHNQYPEEDGGGWETSIEDNGNFLDVLVAEGYLPSSIVDPINTGSNYYRYYRYSPSNCNGASDHFYVLGIRDMETSGRPHPNSPGWSCSNRNWQNEMDWVTGKFE